MSRSLARHGFGTVVAYNTDPEVSTPLAASMTAIGEVKSVNAPQPSPSDGDITHLGSDNGFKEFLPGFLDGGSMELTVNFIEASLNLYNAEQTFGKKQMIRLTLPIRRDHTTATKIVFRGYIKMAPFPVIPEDGPITGTLTFKVDGPVTISLGAA